MLSGEILNYITNHQEEEYRLLKTLSRIPAPSNHEEKRAEFIKAYLEDLGAEGVYIDSALNVVYPYELDRHEKLHIFMAHTDVVFPDTTELPYEESGDKMMCPGIGDDTANVVAILMVIKFLLEHRFHTKDAGILFVLNSGEEGLGNLKGSRKICDDFRDRILTFTSFDGTMEGIVERAVGSSRFRVNVKTQGGHSYGDFGNNNAIHILALMIRDIYEIRIPEEGKTTVNVGVVSGGTSVNTIAQDAEMLCEYRSDSRQSLNYMKEQFQGIFEKYHGGRVEVTVTQVGERPCENLSEEAERIREELISAASGVISKYNGKLPKRQPSSTDCNIPLSLGIPSVCYGVVSGGLAHTREEYVLRSSLEKGLKVAMDSILKYFEDA